MKPIDYRNETFEQVYDRLDELRAVVYRAFQLHGANTTRELARKAGIDILSLRPRVTELYQLGLVELANPEAGGGEGVYQAVLYVVAKARFEKRKAQENDNQLTLL
jgi:hypothetical protein